MPGFEVINFKEENSLKKIFSKGKGVLFRHGFEKLRGKSYQVRDFEKNFAKKFKVKYSLAVTSGTAALRIALASCGIKSKDEIITQSFTFVATVEAIVESGAKPICTEIDDTLNMCPFDLEKKITKKTKAVIVVHMLGVPANLSEIKKICKKHKLILIEDTCEALGSKFKDKQLGTFGDFSSFSFFYSHHITSGEGGMICAKNKKDADVIKTLRSHGWHRAISNKKSNSWSFINSGFNLRPTDISAAIGNSQIKKLNHIIKIRKKNFKSIRKALLEDKNYSNRFDILKENSSNSIVWFGIPIILKSTKKNYKDIVTNKLNKLGIVTRPLISGNFANQPAIKLYNIKINDDLKNADYIDKNSFFIGLHNTITANKSINYIKKALFASL